MSIDDSIKALLAKRDLKAAEAEAAMRLIMKGEVSPVKLSAWLIALRMKGETSAEIAGCAKAMLEQAVKFPKSFPDAVDNVGTGGDGLHTINISTAAAFVASGAGVRVAKHGNRAVSSKSGSADVLSALGVNIALSPEKAGECLEKLGIAFLFAPTFHPAMKHAAPVRKELGVRTIFNILGPLVNPAGAKYAVLGVFSEKLCKTMAEAAQALGFERAMAVHGSDGLDELAVSGSSRVCELRDGAILDYKLSPEELGLPLAATSALVGGTPAENAAILKDILLGKVKGPQRDVVALNAAAAILVSGAADSWLSALKKAEQSIDSGAAAQKLSSLIAMSNS